jgi:superfamily II DNA helicase RecQ
MAKRTRKGTQTAATRREAVEEEYRRWKMMRLVDVDAELRNLVGEGATFRSVQKPAMWAIMQHKSPVVVVMGTGAGKSVLFMLPASVSSGLTVVVVPLVALRGDMKARCDALNIISAEWDSRRPHEWAQVMFVTPESAVGKAFGHFINRQRLMGRLDRIVIDECHVVLDSVGGFRNRMLALRRLVRAETQMVYLTATLRPRDEQQFIEVMGLPGKQQCEWFRGRTTRKNIGYSTHEYDVEEEEDAVRGLVEKLQRKYPPPGQIVVYCGTVSRTKRMAKVLDAVCFHREVGSVAEKKEIVQ